MPPKKASQEYAIFVVNVALPNDEGINKNYLENATEVMKNMIEKKIFMRPNDEAGIIVMGMENDDDISTYQEVQIGSWDMIEKINKLKSRRGVFCNWLGGIQAAVELIIDSYGDIPNDKTTPGKIVCITNYEYHSSLQESFKRFDRTVNMISKNKLSLLCIGSKDLRTMSNAELNTNERKILEFCYQVEGWYATFDFLLPQMRFFEEDPKKFCPWKCDLELFNIKIPTLTVNKVNRQPSGKPWSMVAVENAKGEKIDPVQIDKKRKLIDSGKRAHDPADTVRGYQYGRKFVPVTEDDQRGMKLEQERKSFKLYGVADAKTVGFKCRTESHTWLIFPQEGSQERFFYFLMAMKNLNLVGFVRRIYNDGSPPTMNILVPCTDHPELPWCFLMYQLLYAEEEGIIEAEPLYEEIEELDVKQKEAVGHLIDSMLVDGDGQDTTSKFIPAPDQQHVRNIMAFRALYPEEPIPPPKDYLKALLEPPESVDVEKLKVQVEKIRELFDLEEEEGDEVVEMYQKDGAAEMEVDNAPMKSSQTQSQKEKKSQKN